MAVDRRFRKAILFNPVNPVKTSAQADAGTASLPGRKERGWLPASLFSAISAALPLYRFPQARDVALHEAAGAEQDEELFR